MYGIWHRHLLDVTAPPPTLTGTSPTDFLTFTATGGSVGGGSFAASGGFSHSYSLTIENLQVQEECASHKGLAGLKFKGTATI